MSSPVFFFQVPVPCKSCGQKDLQRVSDLVAADTIACGFCGAQIDVSSTEWRTFLSQTVDALGKITITPR